MTKFKHAAIQFSTLSTWSVFALASFTFVSYICAYAYCNSSGIGKAHCNWTKDERSVELIQRIPLPSKS